MKLSLTVAAAAAVLSATLPTISRADDSALLREMKDRAEIEHLMWRYVHALDNLDPEGYAAVYTPDGRFGTGKNASVGTEALKKIVVDVKKRHDEQAAKGEKPVQLRHILTNEDLEFTDKDHAVMNSYWLTVFEATDPKEGPKVAAAGRGRDELVRVNGHWLITARDVQAKD